VLRATVFLALALSAHAPADAADLRFVVISDAHVPARGADGPRSVVQAILGLDPRPAFVVDTGDATELGLKAEVDQYVELVVKPLAEAGIAVYVSAGNHDARWSDTDLQYLSYVVPTGPRLIRARGLGLLLLSTALPGEQHGHVEPAVLDRLLEESSRIAGPSVAFAHHPALADSPYFSRSPWVLRRLASAGVRVLFVGHGHAWGRWAINGVTQLETAAALDGNYRIVSVHGGRCETWGVDGAGDEVEGTRLVVSVRGVPADNTTVRERGRGQTPPEMPVLWTRNLGSGVFASPVLSYGRVFVACLDGMVRCLRADSGETIWSSRAPGPVQSTPAVAEGRLILGCSSGDILAVSASDGSPLWSVKTAGPVRSSPTVVGASVFIGSSDGAVRYLSAQDGAVRWSTTVGGAIESRPAVAGGRVVFGAWDQKVHCVNAETGVEVWSAPVGRNFYYSPATSNCLIRGGRVFASAPDNTIYAFDLATGAPLWQAEGQAGYTSPTVGPDGTVIYGSMDGSLIGLDPATGDDRFRVDLGPGTFNSSPVAVGDTLVIGGLSGWLMSADARTGRKLAAADRGDASIFATPAFDGQLAVFGTMTGDVIAVRPPWPGR